MAESNVPSEAVAVARDGKIVWEEAFGWADREKRIPATVHTMYSLASLMDMRTTTAYSIEDPVEFRLPYAQQIEVDERHGLTMHEGLRTILRMDPDLILIGEIRDRDSAIVASRAALSGRLVLATIHAHDAVGAIDALHYLGVPYHIIGTSLRLIIAQNLVRQLCGECAQTRELDETERELFARFGEKTPESLLHPGSCAECNWYGYKGRTGIFEVATIDDEVGRLISVGTRNGELGDCLRSKGLRSMAQDGIERIGWEQSSKFSYIGMAKADLLQGAFFDSPLPGIGQHLS